MRSIPASILAALADKEAIESIITVAVQWVDGGAYSRYASKEIPGWTPGKLLSIGSLDGVLTDGAESAEISVTLDDTDGGIKSLFDSHDLHNRPVLIYQHLDGIEGDFVLFEGRVNSPIEWREGERQFQFSVLTQLEDREVGFSAEEGEFSDIPAEMVGQAWPLIFGTCHDVPAININPPVAGTILQSIGIVSGADLHALVKPAHYRSSHQAALELGLAQAESNNLKDAASQWAVAAQSGTQEERDAASAKATELYNRASTILTNAQVRYLAVSSEVERYEQLHADQLLRLKSADLIGPSIIRVLGGESFPQGYPIEVDINGGFFTGKFVGDLFYIYSRRHPENEAEAQATYDQALAESVEIPPLESWYNFSEAGPGDDNIVNSTGRIQVVPTPGTDREWGHVGQIAQHFWADAGSEVRIASNLPQTHIVSLLPGTILTVKAFREISGVRRLSIVPTDFWTQKTLTYGPLAAVGVELLKPLSSLPDQGWDDQLYVTFQSSVGPNTVDILEYLVVNYSTLLADAASFASVKTKVAAFPSNFALLDRRGVMDLLRDITFQARIGMHIKDGTVYLQYLPETPTPVQTVGKGDIDPQSLSIGTTTTEDLVTKMTVVWRSSYAGDPNKMILRHNVAKHGTHAADYDWFIYTDPAAVRKAATFWLIRKSNVWKRVKFSTSSHLLNVETRDAITVDLAQIVAATSVKAIVESAIYDATSNTINFECWLPIRSGEFVEYEFAWPADKQGSFPDVKEINSRNLEITGDLPSPGPPRPDFLDGIAVTGTDVAFQGPADYGDRFPGDSFYTARPPVPAGTDFNVENREQPRADLVVRQMPPFSGGVIYGVSSPGGGGGGITRIDLDTTMIFDPVTQKVAPLRTVIKKIDAVEGDDRLVLDTELYWADASTTAQFPMLTDLGEFGAGFAFFP